MLNNNHEKYYDIAYSIFYSVCKNPACYWYKSTLDVLEQKIP